MINARAKLRDRSVWYFRALALRLKLERSGLFPSFSACVSACGIEVSNIKNSILLKKIFLKEIFLHIALLQ